MISLLRQLFAVLGCLRAGPRIVGAAALWLAAGVVVAVLPALPELESVWWLSGGGGLLAIGLDVWQLRSPPSLDFSRTLPTVMALGEWHDVALRVTNTGTRHVTIELHDGHPASCEVAHLPVTMSLPPGRWLQHAYRCRPTLRGDIEFAPHHVHVLGPTGLVHRFWRPGTADTARVFPNFRAVSKHALMGFSRHGAMAGVHLRRRRGHGLEFHQLREFRDGDSLRQVDWKSVSRRRQLISREFREERNQRVVLAIDCGRRMHARDGDRSLLDRSLDAALLLSYMALRQGDAVGVQTFSGASRWLPPVGGQRALRSILRTVYDLQSTSAPSDYEEAAKSLGARQPRRALVVVLTNLRDDDSADLPRLLAPLRRRHLVLVASLKDPAISACLREPVGDFDRALRRAAAVEHRARRRAAHQLLQQQGVAVVDVEPAELPAALVHRYLEIKRAGLL